VIFALVLPGSSLKRDREREGICFLGLGATTSLQTESGR